VDRKSGATRAHLSKLNGMGSRLGWGQSYLLL